MSDQFICPLSFFAKYSSSTNVQLRYKRSGTSWRDLGPRRSSLDGPAQSVCMFKSELINQSGWLGPGKLVLSRAQWTRMENMILYFLRKHVASSKTFLPVFVCMLLYIMAAQNRRSQTHGVTHPRESAGPSGNSRKQNRLDNDKKSVYFLHLFMVQLFDCCQTRDESQRLEERKVWNTLPY